MNDDLFDAFEDKKKLAKKRDTKSDRFYEQFTVDFQMYFGIPYRRQTGDFVQLARLLGAAPEISAEYWVRAVRNFLRSQMGKYTLADLCTRIEVFHKGRLDRYGKPFNSLHEGNAAALTDWMEKE